MSLHIDGYCEICGSCGEQGCCSFISCFSRLVKEKKCEYGQDYLNHAIFTHALAELGQEIITKLENGLLDANLAIKEYNTRWVEIYDESYKLKTQ